MNQTNFLFICCQPGPWLGLNQRDLGRSFWTPSEIDQPIPVDLPVTYSKCLIFVTCSPRLLFGRSRLDRQRIPVISTDDVTRLVGVLDKLVTYLLEDDAGLSLGDARAN